MISRPSGVTLRFTVVPDKLGALAAHLAAANASLFGFGQIPTIHFARALIVPAQSVPDGASEPDFFVLMTDFDGAQDAHVLELADILAANLDRALECCVGYPASGFAGVQQRAEFLSKHVISSAAMYVNRVAQSVDRVLREHEIRMRLRAHVDSEGALQSLPAGDIVQKLRQFVETDPDCKKLIEDYQPLPRVPQLIDYVVTIVLGLIIICFSCVIIPAILLWALIIRWLEMRDPFVDERPNPAHVDRLQAREDVYPINQFSAYGFIKPQLVRGITARVVLFVVNFVIQRFSANRSLFGVKTIHFARWTYLSNRSLLFASSYDGSLESYMDDFIDRLAWGLNAVFSNGINYPPARWLIFDGAKQEGQFKNFIRVHQLETQIWYSAYPNLTNADIEASNLVCEGLLTERGRDRDLRWLRSI